MDRTWASEAQNTGSIPVRDNVYKDIYWGEGDDAGSIPVKGNMENCIFCKIVKGEEPSHRIWENERHLAFLSIFPNTEGTTVVIPKAHYESYAFDLPDTVLIELLQATRTVAKLLDAGFADVERTAMVFEGFGVNHVHAKLFPMHGTAPMKEWQPRKSNVDKYFEKYEGYISSHDYKREDDSELTKLAQKLRAEKL